MSSAELREPPFPDRQDAPTTPNGDLASQEVTPDSTAEPSGHHAARFSVTAHRDGLDTVVRVSGELDLAAAPHLADVLRHPRSQGGRLEVDVSELWFCDCAGLSVLLDAAQHRRAQGGQLHLLNPTPSVRRLIELIGLNGLEDALGIVPQNSNP